MGAKDIQLRVIPAKIANPFIKAHHYSGKVVNNSCLHFGAFLNGKPDADIRSVLKANGFRWSPKNGA